MSTVEFITGATAAACGLSAQPPWQAVAPVGIGESPYGARAVFGVPARPRVALD
jgi:hypothetical protein